MRLSEAVEASLSTMGTKLQVAQRVTRELQGKHEIVLRNVKKLTQTVSQLESDILSLAR